MCLRCSDVVHAAASCRMVATAAGCASSSDGVRCMPKCDRMLEVEYERERCDREAGGGCARYLLAGVPSSMQNTRPTMSDDTVMVRSSCPRYTKPDMV